MKPYSVSNLQDRSIEILEGNRKINSKERSFWLSHAKWAAESIILCINSNPEHKLWRIFVDQFDHGDWEPNYIGVDSENLLDSHYGLNGFGKMINPIPDAAEFYTPELRIIPDLDPEFSYVGNDLEPSIVIELMEHIISYCDHG